MSPSTARRRYRFGPREQRGVLLGLRAGQLAVLIGAALAGLVTARLAPAGLGLVAGLLVVAALMPVAFAPIAGHTLEQWTPIVLRFAARALTGRLAYRSPTPEAGYRVPQGGPMNSAPSTGTTLRQRWRPGARPAPADPTRALPPELQDLELLGVAHNGAELGVVADRRTGTYTGVVLARAKSFVLLDAAERERRLAAWAGLLASYAHASTPVSRLQWVERTVPEDGNTMARYLAEQRDPRLADPAVAAASRPLRSYLALLADALPVTQQHELLLVLQVDPRKGGRAIRQAGGGDQGGCAVLARELEEFARRLQAADVEVDGALTPRMYAAALRVAFDPAQRAHLAGRSPNSAVAPTVAWPLARDSAWAHVHTDGGWHRTYWIEEWPRLDVGATFLAPLLLHTQATRTVAVTMAPVDPRRAVRQVETARVADTSDEHVRARYGFLQTARRRRQQEGLAQLEEELADGHAVVRFSGWIGVTAGDLDGLERACGEVEHAADQCQLALRVPYGRQAETLTYWLPLGRGLR